MSVYKGYTDNQNKATQKYKKKMGIQKLNIDLPNGKRDEYKAKAASKGLSLSAYIVKLIEEDK